AAMLLYTAVGTDRFAPQPANDTSLFTALAIEATFTFLLVRTILLVATDSRLKNNQFFGVAIGSALMVGAYAGGPISGGAFNPVVGLVPHAFTIPNPVTAVSLAILYSVGPLLGGWLAYALDKKNSS
ncbi:MAG: aquaporin, partial [Patescibacteria group bacterium]|nr:aquaporin [Patescibacteria group bacterium]